MAINVRQLQSYMEEGYNILIQGLHGTGKTAMLVEAAEKAGLTLKYFSTPTLDPQIDLIGVPVPNQENKTIEFYRPTDVDNAEVLVFDELNRSHPQVLNKVFEIIQFRSINGVPLPKLKAVVAAINPVEDGYTTDELDHALVDRFNIFLESDTKASYPYFKAKYGEEYARAGVSLHKEYMKGYNSNQRSRKNNNNMGYFSPRRLDILMEVFKKFPEPATVKATLPSNVMVSAKAVSDTFNIALGNKSGNAKKLVEVFDDALSNDFDKATKVLNLRNADFRSNNNLMAVKESYLWARRNNPKMAVKFRKKATEALSEGIGKTKIVAWKFIIEDFTSTELRVLSSPWSWQKKDDISRVLNIRIY